jgi:hypothetical protein
VWKNRSKVWAPITQYRGTTLQYNKDLNSVAKAAKVTIRYITVKFLTAGNNVYDECVTFLVLGYAS